MFKTKRIKYNTSRPYVIGLNLKEINTIIKHLPKDYGEENKLNYNLVQRLRNLVYNYNK